MTDVTVLEILLHGKRIGTLTQLSNERSIFAFDDRYIEDTNRPTLSLSFKDELGELITDFRPYRMQLQPFFSNMLPEGRMRKYLAERAGVNPNREFSLLWLFGQDLPGAVAARPLDGDSLPPDELEHEAMPEHKRKERIFRFSLAGIQLKFSAILDASGGLTIPVKGIGGSWVIKLPSTRFDNVPRNEFAMMSLAQMVGIDVPEIRLVPLSDIAGLPDGIETVAGSAYAIQRFDRTPGNERIQSEDFAQVFGLYPTDHNKYKKASYSNIAYVLAMETSDDDIAEFIRRLVFNTLIGNADMHIKNWSLIYPDKINAALAPAYDFISTIAFLNDEDAGLKYARTRRMDELTEDELAYLAAKSHVSETLVLTTARDTVSRFHEVWASEKNNLTLDNNTIDILDKHISKLPIANI